MPSEGTSASGVKPQIGPMTSNEEELRFFRLQFFHLCKEDSLRLPTRRHVERMG